MDLKVEKDVVWFGVHDKLLRKLREVM